LADRFTRAETRRIAALGSLNRANHELNSATASDALPPEAKRTAEQKLVSAAAEHRDAQRELDAAQRSLAAAERRMVDARRAMLGSTPTGDRRGPADSGRRTDIAAIRHPLGSRQRAVDNAQVNVRWWAGLSTAQHAALVRAHPADVGNAEGIPPTV